ncbi:MAG: diaminopimelate epimerase [Pseudomonadota bacterium]
MSLTFRKMHGLGNDFVILDNRDYGYSLTADEVRHLADRRQGIGCDQVIVLEKPHKDRDKVDAFMRIFNADGSEAGACGNATRCVASLLMGETNREVVAIETLAGVLIGRAVQTGAEASLIEIDMGRPKFEWSSIPMARDMDTRRLDLRLDDPHGLSLAGPSAVNMGNPHCVFFVDTLEALDVASLGAAVERHALFPEGCNVSFAHITSPDTIRVRVWERGAGLTSACGSAACAVGVAAARRNLAERRTKILLDGGALTITWREADDHVLMAGPIAATFHGVIDPGLLSRAIG